MTAHHSFVFTSRFWHRLFSLLLGLTLLTASNVYASTSSLPDIPTESKVQAQLDQLSKRDVLTTAEQSKRSDLEKILALLDSIDKEKEKAQSQKKMLEEAPRQLQQFNSQLDRLKKPQDEAKFIKQLEAMTLPQLEKRVTQEMQSQQQLQAELANASSELTNLQTLPERAQISMSQAYNRSQDLRNQLGSGKHELSTSQRQLLATELHLLSLQLEQQQRDLDTNTNLQDLALKRQSLASVQIQQLERRIQLIQDQINAKRLDGSNQTVANINTDEAAVQRDPVLEKESKINQQLSQRLIETTQKINELGQENIKIKGWLDRVTQTERNLNEQINMLRGSLLLSRILYQERQMLPDPKITMNLDEQIADLRLAQFDINQQRDQLFQREQYLSKLIADSSTTDKASQQSLHDDLNELLDSRKELLDQLNKQLGSQLNLSINIKLNQQQLQRVNRTVQTTLQQQMFWVSSNKPLDWAWFKALPSAVITQLEAASINLHPSEWAGKTLPLLILIVPMLIVGAVLRWKRQTLRDKVKALSKDIGRLNRDSHLHTPKALLFTGLEVLPGALLIMAIGLLFLFSGLSEPKVIWFLALRLTAAYMAFAMLLKILRPGGMAESHFNQNPNETARKYRAPKYVWRSLIPLIIVATLGELDPSRLADDAIGQLVTLTMLVITLILVYPLFRSRTHMGEQNDWLQWFSAAALTLAPIALIVLVVLGYYYTALKLTNRFIDTFYLFMAWSIVQQTAIRGLSVAARRLAHRRAVARREQLKQHEDIDATELIEDKPMALEDINEQSLRLTKVVLFVLLAGGFYWLWSDLVAVISYLDSITLWHTTTGAAGSEVLLPVSLRDFLLATLFAVIAWVLTKNLPGLLEVLVLSRMQLGQGANYTITTMLSYTITSVGVLLSLATLGMSWDKLQWLVAALSLGIGFGLQEIFANFVSGLIILFERPVRIGDVITLGTFSGSVSKIRIRATTVTDFDRKEIIVPNKMFITTQLTNWSLSDTTTRVILRIGVAYGSDLDKTRELLLQAAKENNRVMREPEPVVYFLNFGASTLDHEMRLYVKELGDRNPAIDEINRRIDKLFREHGIEIAFNQVDVYVKNMATEQELKLGTTQIMGAAAAGGATGTPPALPPV